MAGIATASPRSAVIQSRPAGRSVCSMRALVSTAAVADHHHALQAEALLQLVDLRRQGQRIGSVAFEHLDRDRAALGRAHQADDQLRPVATMVAAVAMLRQFAAAPFEVEPALAKAGVEVTS